MTGWLSLVRPGDLVVVAQGVGEPTPLLTDLLDAAPADVEVFVGLSHSDALTGPTSMPLVSFGALGPLGRPPHRGTVEIVPAHFDDLARVLPHRGRDLVLLMQVAEADASGRHSLGVAVDHTYELVGRARTVVAEVNAQLPVTSAPRLPASTFDACVPTSRPLPVVAVPEVGEPQRRIAEHVAGLVPDGATVQLGLGALSTAIGCALSGHRDLAVRSTLAADWLLDLVSSGAVRPERATICEAAGSPELYKLVGASDVAIRPVREVAAVDSERFVAVNSALQVDLSGQVNAEELPAGYVGAIGGQAEYLRAAQRSPGGCAVVALPATAGRHSRIVPHLTTVTTPRSGVDVVVTEHGVADLRGRGLRERADALIAVAAPEHRDALREGTDR
ncbi:acetyl-CoA hydrolase/transferase family protein [Pseudonocardia endophytica]|uniref:Acetyl-CoA hydrolase n=1 Tax=Pseudonocardia endophytica TaxID=401976 RepID=A0A4R1HWQ8_PSEEN|nr:acetyl-CoA hydrolase/transferase C-terminal domain-containing protein [Pseudonocardia endophytica]TCK25200.1 acetyl-CoA hydrolase [Pseudonocardia endophytica]